MNYLISLMVCSLFICLTLEIRYEKPSNQIRSAILLKQRIYSTKEELQLTKADPRINAKPCNDVHPLSVFILSAGHSSGLYFLRRMVQRNTWVPELKSLNISVYFVIALHIDETVNEELREESDEYQDMIQFSFIDHYLNLTLKTISILRWVNKRCLSSSYILKVDDDVLVNSRLLLDKLWEFKTGFNGIPICMDKPNRYPNDFINYMPYECFPNDTIPCYMFGGAYMMAGNVTHTLMKTFDRFPLCVIQIEAVFCTGILSEMAGIRRHSTSLIQYSTFPDVYTFNETAVIFQFSYIKHIKWFWSKWSKWITFQNESNKLTPSPKPVTHPHINYDIPVVLIIVIVFAVILSGRRFHR